MDRGAILLGARRKLMAYTPFNALIGIDVGQDTGAGYTDGWVFRQLNTTDDPPVNPANSGKAAVMLSIWQPWTTPNMHNTLRFPTLRVVVTADPTRADPGAPGALFARNDSADRAGRVADTIFDCFHDPANVSHWWPYPGATEGVSIVSCLAATEPVMRSVFNSDGLTEAEVRFALEIG